MVSFIGVTDLNNEKLIVNVSQILWFKPYNHSSSIIYLATQGKNDYPVSLTVKESQETILRYIVNATK